MCAQAFFSNNNKNDENPELETRAEKLSNRWEEILEDFRLPCPVCKGEMVMQGVSPSRLYEFAEGEPGTVSPLELMPIEFICTRCGYTAEFDSQLFNPAYLARLEGAKPERVARLSIRDYRVLVPLRGDERSNTLLDLATAIAKSRNGDILILDASSQESTSVLLKDKIQDYTPRVGSPAPVNLIRRTPEPLQVNLTHAVTRNRCDLLLIEARGWGRDGQADVGSLIEEILIEDLCEVGIVHDRGLRQVNRVLLATSGGPNAQAATPLVLDVVRAFDAELHLLYVTSPEEPSNQTTGQNRFADTLGDLDVGNIKMQTRVVVSSNPVQALINESAGYDLLVLGGSPRDWRGKIRLNSFSAKVARNSDTTTIVLIAPGDQPVSFFNRLLGL
jgi:nucleotide-binding universal stress UspA family protein